MTLTKVYNTTIRIEAFIILQLKYLVKEIIEKIGPNKSTISCIKKRVKERGYTPKINSKIIIAYIEDILQSGRPKKITAEVEEKIIKVISKNLTIY
jgi:transposase